MIGYPARALYLANFLAFSPISFDRIGKELHQHFTDAEIGTIGSNLLKLRSAIQIEAARRLGERGLAC